MAWSDATADVSLARIRAWIYMGMAIDITMAMIAATMISSIRVNPRESRTGNSLPPLPASLSLLLQHHGAAAWGHRRLGGGDAGGIEIEHEAMGRGEGPRARGA